LSFVINSCAITNNLSDGYDTGDITKGIVEDVKIYCSPPISYIRKGARIAILSIAGILLPDPCLLKVLDF